MEALPRKDTPTQAQRADTEAMLAWGAPPGLLPQMPKLRWAQALTAGVEGWLALPDLPPALTLTCARGTHRESMAENIMGALFHLTKPYAAIVEDQKHSKWTRRVATPLAGQTLGILGLGVIGQQVAQIAATIGMRVIGTKRRAAALTGVAEVLPPEQTDEVLAQSDFVLLLLPATPETENFMNARRLARMKPTAWLLNFGRGHLIADADLIAAVQAKRIAGAILDVFRQEPSAGRASVLDHRAASSCCRTSAAAIRSATRSWRGCSRTISPDSSTTSRSGRWWIAPSAIDGQVRALA